MLVNTRQPVIIFDEHVYSRLLWDNAGIKRSRFVTLSTDLRSITVPRPLLRPYFRGELVAPKLIVLKSIVSNVITHYQSLAFYLLRSSWILLMMEMMVIFLLKWLSLIDDVIRL